MSSRKVLSKRTPSSEKNNLLDELTLMLERFWQPTKQPLPITDTEDGREIDIRFVQSVKHLFPIAVTDDGIVMCSVAAL